MNQRNTTRTILAVIIASALVISVGGLTALHTLSADATKPKQNDDDNGNDNSGGDNVVNTLPQQPQLAPLGMGISPNAGDTVGGDDTASQQTQPQAQQAQPQAQQAQPQAQQAQPQAQQAQPQAQQAQPQAQQAQPQAQQAQQAQPQAQAQQVAEPISAACGQVVSGVVNLTANLNCSSGDGIIVGGPNTVINMNGFSITGPGQDSSKVGIMVPNVDNVVVNGPGSIS